jgi:hypothetical protein
MSGFIAGGNQLLSMLLRSASMQPNDYFEFLAGDFPGFSAILRYFLHIGRVF